MKLDPGTGVAIGTLLGAAYFWMAERSVPKTSNCVYLAPWTTDLAAWLVGAWLVQRGYKHKDGIVSMLGSAAASVHVAQYAAHKTLINRGVVNA